MEGRRQAEDGMMPRVEGGWVGGSDGGGGGSGDR